MGKKGIDICDLNGEECTGCWKAESTNEYGFDVYVECLYLRKKKGD